MVCYAPKIGIEEETTPHLINSAMNKARVYGRMAMVWFGSVRFG